MLGHGSVDLHSKDRRIPEILHLDIITGYFTIINLPRRLLEAA